jgi:hypothetical protein
VPVWINRKTRVRHVDPECPAIRLSERYLTDVWDDLDPRRPTDRIAELPDPTDPHEKQAIEAFTTPCTRCVPGARKLYDSFPIYFERTYEYDE